MNDLKPYQPYYLSTKGEWCTIQGYKDDFSDTVIMADSPLRAKTLFFEWIMKRCKSHAWLDKDEWRGYEYDMREVKL